MQLAHNFLINIAPATRQLFILGDFVEYWIGDDADDGSLDLIFNAVAALSSRGVQTYLMHGNRDFLIGQALAERLNATLILEDHYLLEVGQTRLLLLHGDTLCLEDVKYQKMRVQLRDASWKNTFLQKSIKERDVFAKSLRAQSVEQKREIANPIIDVSPEAVLKDLSRFGVTQMLHGHTHRPDTHRFTLNHRQATRWVVGDWHPSHAIYGILDNGNIRLETYAANKATDAT